MPRLGSCCAGERGFVLPFVLFALVIVEALVAAAFVLAVYEQRLGRSLVAFRQARGAAEIGVVEHMIDWDSVLHAALAVGDSVTFSGSADPGFTRYAGAVVRLADHLYLVRTRGMSREPGVTAGYALLLRLDSAGVAPIAERAVVQPF